MQYANNVIQSHAKHRGVTDEQAITYLSALVATTYNKNFIPNPKKLQKYALHIPAIKAMAYVKLCRKNDPLRTDELLKDLDYQEMNLRYQDISSQENNGSISQLPQSIKTSSNSEAPSFSGRKTMNKKTTQKLNKNIIDFLATNTPEEQKRNGTYQSTDRIRSERQAFGRQYLNGGTRSFAESVLKLKQQKPKTIHYRHLDHMHSRLRDYISDVEQQRGI